MVLPYRIRNNKDKIRQAIIKKIKKISSFRRQHPVHKNIKSKFLYFHEPIGIGNYRFDKIDGEHPYHEDRDYNVSWHAVSNKELIEMYHKLKRGETYCFFLEEEGKLGKLVWNNDLNKYVTL